GDILDLQVRVEAGIRQRRAGRRICERRRRVRIADMALRGQTGGRAGESEGALESGRVGERVAGPTGHENRGSQCECAMHLKPPWLKYWRLNIGPLPLPTHRSNG